MRFSPPGRPEFVDEVLGERARALEARAVGHAGAPRGREARVLFSSARVGPDALRELAARAGASLAPAGGADPAWLLFAGPAAALAEQAGSSAVARCLWAAERHARLAPLPQRVMGIVNVTPDSFSDGGAFLSPERAIEHGLQLIDEGADILDVGGESTRPGASPVSADVELERVVPVIRALAADGRARLSVDTSKAGVAAAALEAGAEIVNDVSAGRGDPELLPLVAARGAGVVLVHMQGTPRDMQDRPRYADVVREVTAHLRERAAAAVRAGIDPARIAIDPGLGFGKRLEDNLELLRALPELRSLGLPLLLGVSRKSFLGRLSGEEQPALRAHETSAAVALAAFLGAEIHRVHEVGPARRALRVARALATAGAGH